MGLARTSKTNVNLAKNIFTFTIFAITKYDVDYFKE